MFSPPNCDRPARDPTSAGAASTCTRRLGAHHFAYLRSLAEGLPLEDAARRYLGMAHGHELRSLHRSVVEQLRALARRRGDPRWRLLGVDLGAADRAPAAASLPRGGAPRTAPPPQQPPALEPWARQQGYEDWSQAEQLELYLQAFPPCPAAADPAERKRRRNQRLRLRQLALLRELEQQAVLPAAATDPVAAWLDPALAGRLQRAGLLTLGDVARAIRLGGRWWRGMPHVGPTKAARIEAQLAVLLPADGAGHAARPGQALPAMPASQAAAVAPALAAPGGSLSGAAGSNRARRDPTIAAATDLEAIRAWVASTAGSALTAKAYQREGERFALWCAIERGRPLSSAGPDDCRDYMGFLNRIPDAWMSRRKALRLAAGWTPFKGPLSLASRRFAVRVLSLMCGWLVTHARYLDSNPWGAVNKHLADGDERPPPPPSRAFTPQAFAALLGHLDAQAPSPALHRNRFVLLFARHTGLRAIEMLGARLGQLRRTDAGWMIDVVGKGRKPRSVSVPSPAVAALRQYLQARGLPALEAAPPQAPLLAAVAGDAALGRVSYSAVHQSFKAFVQRAIRSSTLAPDEKALAMKATQHWLRHTYATRAAEAEVPPDVLQAEMGHASPATTAGYYKAQERRRQLLIERASSA